MSLNHHFTSPIIGALSRQGEIMDTAYNAALNIVNDARRRGSACSEGKLYLLMFFLQGWHYSLTGTWCYDEVLEWDGEVPHIPSVAEHIDYLMRADLAASHSRGNADDPILHALMQVYARCSEISLRTLYQNGWGTLQTAAESSGRYSIKSLFSGDRLFSVCDDQGRRLHAEFFDTYRAIVHQVSDWVPPQPDAQTQTELDAILAEL